jgi:hypothetical protein
MTTHIPHPQTVPQQRDHPQEGYSAQPAAYQPAAYQAAAQPAGYQAAQPGAYQAAPGAYQETPSQPGGYSTAPPWAPPAQAAPPPAAGAPWGDTPYTQHGQLMVAYPELMHDASRPAAPSWIPVVLFTFFFGPFGAISAARRAARAKRTRNDRYPYWVAFAATWVAGSVLGGVVATAMMPVYLERLREPAVTSALQSNLVHDGHLKTPKGTAVQTAKCTPTAARGADGLRAYTCSVTLTDGHTGTFKILADSDGNWTAGK